MRILTRSTPAMLVAVALAAPAAAQAPPVTGAPTGWCTDYSGRNFRCSSMPAPRSAPSRSSSGSSGQSYYNNMTSAYNTGMAIGNAMNQAFQAMERQAQMARIQQAINLNNQGIAAYNRGDFGAAAAAFQQAIGLSPNDPNMRGNLAEAHKRLAEQHEARERHHRQQMAEAKARIEGMLGGLQSQLASERSTLNAGLGDAAFVAPSGTSFFGLGGGQPAPPVAAKPGELAFVAPGDSLFSKGTQYSAPVDLRDTASDQFAAAQPAGAGAAAKPAEAAGGLQFVAPEQPFTATVAAPKTAAARPPAARETIAERKQATRTKRSETPDKTASRRDDDGFRTSAPRAEEPDKGARDKRLETLRAFDRDTAAKSVLLARLKRGELKTSDLSAEQRRDLADLLRAGRSWNEAEQSEIAAKLMAAADGAWIEGSRQYLLAKPGDLHANAEVAGMGMAGFGLAQTGAGFAQYGTKMPLATAFSLGQATGGLYADDGLRKAGAGIVGLGDATEIVDEGFESGLKPGWHLPGGKLPSKAVSAAGAAGDSTDAVLKGLEARQRFEAGDSTGGWLAGAGAAASGAEVAAEGAKWLGKDAGGAVFKKLGGVSEIVSGAGVVREGVKGSIDAAGNRVQADINSRLLLNNAETLGHQSRYYARRAEIANTAQSDFGRALLKELEAAR